MEIHLEKILIVDFGSQVTQLIARRIRENNVYCEIIPYNKIDNNLVKQFNPKGIVLSGGPSSVLDEFSPTIDKNIFDLNIPILGICYGQQLICHLLGGKVEKGEDGEFGRAKLIAKNYNDLFSDNIFDNNQTTVWMSHADRVIEIPSNFDVIATSEGAPYAAIYCKDKPIYAMQFHPEVTHTVKGKEILKNFTHNICGCSGDWNMHQFLEYEIDKVKAQVGAKNVICAVSGGVDSTVVAVLLNKAIGKQLKCIFVDTGLLRYNEAEDVQKLFGDSCGVELITIDAKEIFMKKLAGISDPEQKRKIIGNTFIEIFEQEAKKIDNAEFLAQGTLYPDVVESVSVHSDAGVTIKSHHNVGGLPEKMNMKLVEPLRELFKDEVRKLGRELGIPAYAIERHPFPGPGLAIRIIGEISEEKIDILQKADKLYIDAIKEYGLYNEIWQAFAALLPVKTVGVMGDDRTYDYVLALRAVTSQDGMTAEAYHFNGEFLDYISTKIVNNIKGVNRVVYDITSKPPGTIEWE